MSLTGPHPSDIPRLPPPRLCPQCACELDGAGLCEVCGAADFHGAGLWICYSCGQNNGPMEPRCRGCGKNHVIACPACGYETFHRDVRCESCGAARALFPAIRRMLTEISDLDRHREFQRRPLVLSLVIALMALMLAAVLGSGGKRAEATYCWGCGGVALVAVGCLSWRRRQSRSSAN